MKKSDYMILDMEKVKDSLEAISKERLEEFIKFMEAKNEEN